MDCVELEPEGARLLRRPRRAGHGRVGLASPRRLRIAPPGGREGNISKWEAYRGTGWTASAEGRLDFLRVFVQPGGVIGPSCCACADCGCGAQNHLGEGEFRKST